VQRVGPTATVPPQGMMAVVGGDRMQARVADGQLTQIVLDKGPLNGCVRVC